MDLKALDDSRVQYLGKKGELTDLLKGLGKPLKKRDQRWARRLMKPKSKSRNSSNLAKKSSKRSFLIRDFLMKKSMSRYQAGTQKKEAFILSLKRSITFKIFSLRLALG
jgi:hypothetical protein